MSSFEDWVRERERELLLADRFAEMGKSEDYVFQALVFAGKSSQQLSLAATVLQVQNEIPEELKSELRGVQQQLHAFTEKLRQVKTED